MVTTDADIAVAGTVIVVVAAGSVCAVTVALLISLDDHQYVPVPPEPTAISEESAASVADGGEIVTGAAATTVIEAVEEFPSSSITLSVVVPVATAVNIIDARVLVCVGTVATPVSDVDHQ